MRLSFLLFISALFINSTADAQGLGWQNALMRGNVACGTDLSTDAYARKDDNGFWQGIDADICRLFSFAVFGNANSFQMVQTSPEQAAKYLKNGKIDVMLSQAPATATSEINSNAIPAEIIYYDNQVFLADSENNATSMEDYIGQKVCSVTNSENLYYLDDFNERYGLELKILKYPSFQKAKEAFLIKRCQLISGSETQMKSILKMSTVQNRKLLVLPEVIAIKPVYAQIAPNNDILRRQIKWIINAPILAEHLKISSQNIDTFISSKDKSTQNLFGINPDLWKSFSLSPDGMKKAIKELGNYGEIYDRNLGSESEFQIKRDKNKLIEDGGLIKYQLFL